MGKEQVPLQEMRVQLDFEELSRQVGEVAQNLVFYDSVCNECCLVVA